MIRGSFRARGKQVALLCGLGVIAVGVLGVHHAIRHVRESRAIEALESESREEWKAALEELGRMRSLRAIPHILRSTDTSGHVILIGIADNGAHDMDMDFDDPRLDEQERRDFLKKVGAISSREDLCARVILDMGRGAAPYLRASLRSENSTERFLALYLLGRSEMFLPDGVGPGLPLLLDDPEPPVRREAAIAFGMAASTNPGLVDRIIADLERPDASERLGIAAVHALGLAAVLAVREGSRETSAGEGEDGSRLQPTGRHQVASTAVSALIEGAQSPSIHLRGASMKALCAVVRHRQLLGDLDLRKTIQDTTERWLVDADTPTRWLGMKWVQRAFETAAGDETLPRRALDLIARRLSDPDRELRDVAAEMLERPAAVPVLIEVLEKGDPEARPHAVHLLEVIRGEDAWTSLFDLLPRAGDSLRQTVVELLCSLGEGDGTGIDRLLQALASGDPALRRAAAAVLARYQANGSFDNLVLFDHEDEEVRSKAVETLTWNGTLTVELFESRVMDYLLRARTDSLRRSACKAAEWLGPEAVKAVPHLISLIEMEPWAGQKAAVKALRAMGAAARAAVPALVRLSRRADQELADEAIEALDAISGVQ